MKAKKITQVQEPAVAYAPVASQYDIRIHQEGYPVQQIRIVQEEQYFSGIIPTFKRGFLFMILRH